MAECRHLKKAPITEALIDFRFQVPLEKRVEAIEAELLGLAFGYFRKSPISRGSLGFSINPEQVPIAKYLPSDVRNIGVRYHSKDERYVAQFSIDGFTLSRLAPYESWGSLLAETKRVWELYGRVAGQRSIGRVAVRFINGLKLPVSPNEPLESFLTHLPQFSPDLPQHVSSFLQRFVMQDSVADATIILTQALEDASSEPYRSVILDIDAFCSRSFPPNDPSMWQSLDELRALKNRYFFSSLTERALEPYL